MYIQIYNERCGSLSNNYSENKNIKILNFIALSFKKHFMLSVLVVLVFPIFFMSLLAIVVKSGSGLIGKSGLIIDFSKEVDIGNYIYWCSCFLVIEVTAIFSYVLWKSSERNNNLSEQIKKKEDNRDNEIVRENALIVYFDLLMGLDDLRKLYSYHVLGEKKYYPNPPKELFFSREWIKNVAVLKNKLSTNDIRTVYNLYGKLLTIKERVINENKDLAINDIKELFLEVFENRIPGALNYFYIEDIRKIMKSEYLILLNAIEVLTYNTLNIENKDDIVNLSNQYYYKGNLQNGIFSGYGEYFNKHESEVESNLENTDLKIDRVTFDGEFNNNKFISGSRTEYYDNGQLWYRCFINKSKLLEEYIIIYKDGSEIYRGAIKEGKYLNGKGALHLKELEENDYLKQYLFGDRRDQYRRPAFMYKGEFKDGKFNGDGRITYTRELLNEKFKEGNELLKNEIILCKGEFQCGQLINGEGKIIKENGIFEGKWVDGEIQDASYISFDGIHHIEKIVRFKFKDEYENGTNKRTPSNKAYLGFSMFKGIGTVYTSRGLILYKGEMKHFNWHGKGKEFFITDKNQLKYIGDFVESNYHGSGIEYYDNEEHSIKFEGIFENGKYKSGKHYNENADLLFDGDFEKEKLKNGLVYRAAQFKLNRYELAFLLPERNVSEEYICEGEFKDFKPLEGCLVIDKNNDEIGILKILSDSKYIIISNKDK